MIFVKHAGVLSDRVQGSSRCAKCPAVGAMRMGCTDDIWSGVVYFRMDGECGKIKKSIPTTANDFSVVAHMNEIVWGDEGEVKT